MAEVEAGPRRSLRKREEKSYAESPDLIIEEDSIGAAGVAGRSHLLKNVNMSSMSPNNQTGVSDNQALSKVNAAEIVAAVEAKAPEEAAAPVILNNGDVEMESENEEDEVSAPVAAIPLPKVSVSTIYQRSLPIINP